MDNKTVAKNRKATGTARKTNYGSGGATKAKANKAKPRNTMLSNRAKFIKDLETVETTMRSWPTDIEKTDRRDNDFKSNCLAYLTEIIKLAHETIESGGLMRLDDDFIEGEVIEESAAISA